MNSETICAGQSATLTATPSSPGGTYSWSPGGATTQNITVNPTSTTTYTVSYTLPGCPTSGTATGTVTVSTPLNVTTSAPPIACGQTNGSVTINASGGTQPYSYSIDAGNTYQSSPVFNTLNPGAYTFRIKDFIGCTTDVGASLQPAIIPNLVITDPLPVCAPATINLNASAITAGSDPGLVFTYWMDSAATTPLGNSSAVSIPGTYYIKATETGGCFVTRPVQLTIETSAPGIRYNTIMTLPNQPQVLQARGFLNTNTWLWSPPSGLNNPGIHNPVFNDNKKTEYQITITSTTGCITVDTLLVDLLSDAPNVFVPKAWSPNGDGHNDLLFPNTVNITQLNSFIIYNRWGQKVFETNQTGQGWDGKLNGVAQSMDVYIWILHAIGINGEKFRATGQAVLLR